MELQDGFVGGMPHGEVADHLISNALIDNNMDVGLIRPYQKVNKRGRVLGVFANIGGKEKRILGNAVLRKDEWKEYDQALLEASKIRLVGVADLLRRGLNHNIANGFGKTVLEYEDITEGHDAEINMDGLTRGKNDRLEYSIKYLPLPIIHKAFSINARVLTVSRNTGGSLDMAQVTEATFKVSEKVEEILFTGASTFTFGGGIIYGYTDFPSRITGSITTAWTSLSDNSTQTVGEQVLTQVLTMIQDSRNAKHYGPWVLYVPTAYQRILEEDYTTGYGKSIRARLLETQGLDDIIVADKLTADNLVLAQVTSNVVRMVTGMPMSTVEWETEGKMIHHFKVMTIMVPQLRADANGNTGIVHYS